MAIGASILRGEIRRHLLMNIGLVSSCVVGATVVTNERGLFVPITADVSDTSRAFAAMFTQSRLLPEQISAVQMVTPLAPFEVTADSRDLRRRLMDALATNNDPVTGAVPQEFQQNASQTPTLDNQVLSLNGPTGQPAGSGASAGAPAAGGGGSSGGNSGGNGTTVASTTGTPASTTTGTTGNNGSTTTTNNSQPITVASASNPAQTASSSGVSDGSSLGNSSGASQTGDGSSLGNSGSTDQNGSGPAAVPEPSIWAMLIAGFGMIGYILRTSGRRKDEQEADAAA